MNITLLFLVSVCLIMGCSSKQQVVLPTSSVTAPTIQLKHTEAGGGQGSGFELLKNQPAK